MTPSKPDLIFSHKQRQVKDFAFDAHVVEVFPDMISRSVPGYHTIIDTIGQFSQQYVTESTNIYDLGCSLGAATLAMRQGIKTKGCRIIGVDNSAAMVDRCRRHVLAFKGETPVEIIEDDVLAINIENASMVVLNFTLQFIDPDKRAQLIQTIFDGLTPGGILVISDKFIHPDNACNQTLIDLHHDFKRANGYSDLEIAQKRTALENVMKPDSLEDHHLRLANTGFSQSSTWFQCYNFFSLFAIK
ncbi:carboxy-S-adenosyl-L-methionine synthase CmoA [Thalassotalea hakodatensis]|uniref:carboxy-S-adenosyl-L-methionine synthase CmoA n=1 Tax=Thalassotalea hakodatensis TaxID=3030492 RepID=UPI002573EF9D|nr:carboxy-S-adenosyl-L-methionine synthase CmoA [Thalassotalea hakodatensis]